MPTDSWEATRRWAGEGIYANALNPGSIATNLQKHTGGLKTPPEKRKTPQQGAATSVLLATSPLLAGIGGATLRIAMTLRSFLVVLQTSAAVLMAEHKTFTVATDVKVYFCADPTPNDSRGLAKAGEVPRFPLRGIPASLARFALFLNSVSLSWK